MSDLFKLVKTDLPTLVDSLDDVSRDLVRDLTLFSRGVQAASVDIGLVVLPRFLDPFPCQVRTCVLPHRVKAGPVGLGSMLCEVLTMPKLPSRDQSSASGTFGTILQWWWPSLSFVV